jgi:hypothetical protein
MKIYFMRKLREDQIGTTVAGLQFKNVKIKIYNTIIFPVVLHGCETWFLMLREEHRLRVFENEF